LDEMDVPIAIIAIHEIEEEEKSGRKNEKRK
jgi:hypothetical protein